MTATAKPITPFAPTVVREDEQGRLWLMNRKDKGWGEYGEVFDSWPALLAVYAITVGERGHDSCSPYWEASPAKEARP